MQRLLPSLLCLAVVSPCVASEYPVDQWRAWLADSTNRCPQETWMQYATPEEAGWCGEKLDQAREYFESLNSAAVFVVYDGAVLAAWGDVRRRYMCHSVRKSLLSALYGIHAGEGRIDLNKTLAELNVDDNPPLTDAEKQARVIDLLKSRSGIYHSAAYETATMKKSRPARGSHQPGERFWYNNWDFNALCTIFEQETGTRVFEEFGRRFAAPLGMEDFRLQDMYYHLEPKHSIHPAYPFRLSARDMARLGLLLLRKGNWSGRQILTPEWVAQSTASHFEPGDTTANRQYAYGYLWWRFVDGPFEQLEAYSARGYGGHAIDVLPVANLVLVHRVDTFWDLDPPLGRQRRRVRDSERFKLLDLILRARVSKPAAEAKLVPLALAKRRTATVKLAPDVLARYTAQYDFGEFKLRVKAASDGLLIGGPGMGDFGLLPLSATEFVIEDLEVPVTFELDDDGTPLQAVGEFVPGKKTTGRPVQVKGDDVSRQATAADFTWRQTETSIALLHHGHVVWQHVHDRKVGKPFMRIGLIDGTELTRPWPFAQDYLKADHTWHRALWWSWKSINGVNYWEENQKGTEPVKVEIVHTEDGTAHIEMDVEYHLPGKPPVVVEKRTIRVGRPDASGDYLIDWQATFTPAGKEGVVFNRNRCRERRPVQTAARPRCASA